MISTLQVTIKKNFAQSEQEIALEKAKCSFRRRYKGNASP